MKPLGWLALLVLSAFVLSCSHGITYPLYVRYVPSKDFPELRQKIGPTLALAPFRDEREDKTRIGVHRPMQGSPNYFKSEPFPLEKAIGDSLSEVLSRYGISSVPVPEWDGRPESLKSLDADSVLMIEIKRFWSEGQGSLFGTKLKMSVQMVIHLGIKKEGKVFTRNVEAEKEVTVTKSTPERVEGMFNRILSDIFDAYFSNPY